MSPQIANAEGIDWNDSGIQVKLKLTDNPDIIESRKRDKSTWQKERGGREALVLRNNSREFRFYRGEDGLVVPAPVAHGLIHNSVCTVGTDALTDPFEPALEIVSNWQLGQKEPGNHKATCPEHDCGEEFASARELAKHIMSVHSDEPLTTTPNMDAHLKGKKVPASV